MQINLALALYNYKIPVIIKEKTLHYSVPVNHRKTFQLFSRTYKQNLRASKDSPGQQKNPGLFQDVAILSYSLVK